MMFLTGTLARGARRAAVMGWLGCAVLGASADPIDYGFAFADAQADNGGASTWTTRASLTLTPEDTDDWVILASAEGWAVGGNAIRFQLVQTAPTAETLGESAYRISGDPWPVGSTHKVVTLTGGQTYTFALQYIAHNQNFLYTTGYIRNARIIAIKQSQLEIHRAEPASSPYLLAFNADEAGDYLVIYSGEHSGAPATINALLNGNTLDSQTRGRLRGETHQDYHTFLSFNVATLAAGAHTAALTGTVTPRRPRLTAIRLTGSRFAGATSASSAGGSTTASTDFAMKLTHTFAVPADWRWAILASGRIGNDTAANLTEARVRLNGAHTLTDTAFQVVSAGDFFAMGGVVVRGLLTGDNTLEVDWRVATGGTGSIRNVTVVALPLGLMPLEIVTTTLSAGFIGIPLDRGIRAAGGVTPYAWSLLDGALPDGLTLDGATGVISGTPAADGTFFFTAQVQDDEDTTTTMALTLTIESTPLAISTATLPDGIVTVAYSQTLQAHGGVTPHGWTLADGSDPLPAGLELSSAGALSGTPAAPGDFVFTVEVTDAVAQTVTKTFALTMTTIALELTTGSLPDTAIGASYSETLAASGGIPPYAWSLLAGSLPGGMTLNPGTGAIAAGEVEAPGGTYAFTVEIADSQEPPEKTTQALTIFVIVPPTYLFASADGEVNNGGVSAWTTRTSLTIAPVVTDEWLILSMAEGWAEGGNAIRFQLVQTAPTVDTLGESAYRISGSPWPLGATHKVVTLTGGQTYTFALQYIAHNQEFLYTTAYIRNARIIAIKKSELELHRAEPAAAPYALSFNVASGGDYLLIYSGEHSANPATIDALLNTEVIDTQTRGRFRGETHQDYHAFLSFHVASLEAGDHTAAIAGSVTPRRPRITAIRLSDGRLAGAVSASSAGVSTTVSPAYTTKLTQSLVIPQTFGLDADAHWAILASGRISNDTASRLTDAGVRLNGLHALTDTAFQFVSAGDFFGMGGAVVARCPPALTPSKSNGRSGRAARAASATRPWSPCRWMPIPMPAPGDCS